MKIAKLVGLACLVIALAAACAANTDTATTLPAPTNSPATAIPVTIVATQTAPAPAATPGPVDPTSTVNTESTSTPIPQATATNLPAPATVSVVLQKIVDGLEPLTYLTYAGDNTRRLYLITKPGRILVYENGSVRSQPFLNISDRVGSTGYEQGLLSAAFSPHYASDNTFYVYYTNKLGSIVVSRFTAARDTATADSNSEQILLTIEKSYNNHNGGQLQFGPDGMLYIGTGDGGSERDPFNIGQNTSVLLAKLLRVDVSQAGKPYTIPADNPKLGGGARPETWAYGLRNPWRFSFDRTTGDLYIADVGQDKYEEIDLQPAGDHGGENYGWSLYEGFEPYKGNGGSAGLTMPIYAYGHDLGCAIVGGYVYRGAQIAGLDGAYLYSDNCSGHIWSLRRGSDGKWQNALLVESGPNISSFGEDAAGELYVIALTGAIYEIIPQ
jgi:glucose/arabinose dehydrogenase